MTVILVIAAILAFLAFRFIAGMMKLGVLMLIVLAVLYFLSQSGGIG